MVPVIPGIVGTESPDAGHTLFGRHSSKLVVNDGALGVAMELVKRELVSGMCLR